MNLFQEIIESKNRKKPDEVKELLCKAMNVRTLHLSAVLEFLDKQRVSVEDALDVGLYLHLKNLLELD